MSHPVSGNVGHPPASHETRDLPSRPIVIAIGPEGGFGERDRAALAAGGFRGVRLGPRVLRTETAGLAALAALQALAGDFR
jgi:16S rRNA (uracil1498-N3)-methyltransferase